MNDSVKPLIEQAGQPVSARIRARLARAQQRFHANDNIAAYLEPGDLELLLDEVAGKMQIGRAHV